MTIDERLEFLLKSTESLHVSVHELYETAQKHTEQIEAHTAQLQEQTKQMAIVTDNIRQLALIATAHGDRISAIEQANRG
jgi:methyl-accepting chemotaxis protein